MAERSMPAPVPNPETEAYWQAARAHRLLIKHCNACGENHFYPRAFCPFCFSDQTVWRDSKGQGTIYSYTIARRAPTPYALAYVALDEGVTMMTNIVGCDLDSIRIGQRVSVTFQPTEDGPPVPVFTPVR